MHSGRRILLGAALLGCCVTGILLIQLRSEPTPIAPAQSASTSTEPTVSPEPVAAHPRESVVGAQEVEQQEAADPSTLGAALAEKPAAAPDPISDSGRIDATVLPDPRLGKVMLVAQKGVANGKETGNVHWMPEALLKLMTERRYWYLGPPAACPAYRNTPDVRYVATSLPGSQAEPAAKVVFEVTRKEFPRAFENYSVTKATSK